MTMMYMFNLQYELPGNQLIEIGYLGSQLRHLEQLARRQRGYSGGHGFDRQPFAVPGVRPHSVGRQRRNTATTTASP